MAWPKFLRRLFGGPEPVPAPAPPEPPDRWARAREIRARLERERNAPAPVAPPVPPPRIAARNPELEAAIVESHDPASYLVYADWLQDHGDPRGELITIHHRLVTELDPARRRELATRESALLAEHGTHLVGPMYRAIEPRFHLGFVRGLDVWSDVEPAMLRAQLTHAACLVLATITAPVYLHDKIRAVVTELGMQLAIVDDQAVATEIPESETMLEGHLTLEGRGGLCWISATFDAQRWMNEGAHAFLVRATVTRERPEETEARTWQWSFGCDAAVSEESLGDDPLRTERYPLPRSAEPATLVVELRLVISGAEHELVAAYRGTVALPALDTAELDLVLARCDRLTGTPFEPSPIDERTAPVGPTLLDGDSRLGVAIPDHGVVREANLASYVLLAPGASPRVLAGLTPPANCHLAWLQAGLDDTVVAIHHNGKPGPHHWLSFVTLPAATQVRHPVADIILGTLVVTKGRVAIVTATHVHLVDARTGIETWRRPLSVDVQEVRDHADAFAVALVEHDDQLHVMRAGHVTAFDLRSGTVGAVTELPALVLANRQYGAGATTFHPAPGRAAWMVCANYPVARDPSLGPVSIIGWRDRDGTGGDVVVAEAGWAQDGDSFARVAVLPDGRILAIGTSVWLVVPPERRAIRLGAAVGRYGAPLCLTRIASGWRLWSHGPGPWYLDVDDDVR